LRYLSNATIHIDPVGASGEAYHGIENGIVKLSYNSM